jgi:hypothetical protein
LGGRFKKIKNSIRYRKIFLLWIGTIIALLLNEEKKISNIQVRRNEIPRFGVGGG